jgi:chromosome segregation ATPase
VRPHSAQHRAVEDALGDLDALHELLEPRPVPRLNSWDLNKFKSEYPELMEKVKELKLALRSQIERAKRARGEVGPLQEEIAQRFASLAKEVSEQRAAADLANTELVTERRKAEQRAKTIVELKASIEALSADLTEAKQKVANEGLRANTAEASLRERSEDLQSALSAGEDLRVAKDAAAAAAEEAAATASAEIERLVAAFSATTATLEGTRAAAAEKEAELTASLDAQRARTAELEKQLGIALAEASMLVEAKAALDKAHANLSETAAVTRATLESTQKQLDEKSATLLQKDEVRLPR